MQQKTLYGAGVLIALLAFGCDTEKPVDPVVETEELDLSCSNTGQSGESLALGNDGNLKLDHSTTVAAPTALETPEASPWTSGRSLAYHNGLLAVVDTENGELVVMDASSMKRTHAFDVGQRPEQVVIDAQGTAYVSGRHAGQVLRVQGVASPNTVVEGLSLGLEPVGLALSVDQKTLYVTIYGENVLAAVDTLSFKEIARLDTLAYPRAVTVGRDGNVVVTHVNDGPMSAQVKPDGVFTGDVRFLELRTANPWDRHNFQDRLEGLIPNRAVAAVRHPVTGDVYITHVITEPGEIDPPDTEEVVEEHTKSMFVPGGGYGGTTQTTSFQTTKKEALPDLPRPIETSITRVTNVGYGMTTDPGSNNRPVVAPNLTVPSALVDQPRDVAHHPTHSLLLVAGFGSDNVLVLNSGAQNKDPMASPLGIINVGHAPKAIAFSADGATAFVLNAHSFTVSTLDLTPFVAMVGSSAVVPATLKHTSEHKYGKDPLTAQQRLGRRTFTFSHNWRLARRGRFACATCHFEGTEDKLTWMLPDGPRQTPALNHRLSGTGPFNWHGTEDKLHTNMNRTINRMGGQGLNCWQLDALEEFLLVGLPAAPKNPHRSVDGTLTPAQESGRVLFMNPVVGCAGCHAGERTTDGRSWDVGTTELERTLCAEQGRDCSDGVKLNTPSLSGLHYTAPYLHDGSAANLFDLLDMTATTMGHTAHLTADQKGDLVSYLLTL